MAGLGFPVTAWGHCRPVAGRRFHLRNSEDGEGFPRGSAHCQDACRCGVRGRRGGSGDAGLPIDGGEGSPCPGRSWRAWWVSWPVGALLLHVAGVRGQLTSPRAQGLPGGCSDAGGTVRRPWPARAAGPGHGRPFGRRGLVPRALTLVAGRVAGASAGLLPAPFDFHLKFP